MWASVKSTWLTVAPAAIASCSAPRTMWRLCQQHLLFPGPSVLLLCPLTVPQFYSESLNAGRLSVIIGMLERLFGKQDQPSRWSYLFLDCLHSLGLKVDKKYLLSTSGNAPLLSNFSRLFPESRAVSGLLSRELENNTFNSLQVVLYPSNTICPVLLFQLKIHS